MVVRGRSTSTRPIFLRPRSRLGVLPISLRATTAHGELVLSRAVAFPCRRFLQAGSLPSKVPVEIVSGEPRAPDVACVLAAVSIPYDLTRKTANSHEASPRTTRVRPSRLLQSSAFRKVKFGSGVDLNSSGGLVEALQALDRTRRAIVLRAKKAARAEELSEIGSKSSSETEEEDDPVIKEEEEEDVFWGEGRHTIYISSDPDNDDDDDEDEDVFVRGRGRPLAAPLASPHEEEKDQAVDSGEGEEEMEWEGFSE
jgi:hypothetical protein